jgi:signal recognition particle subunit SRP19
VESGSQRGLKTVSGSTLQDGESMQWKLTEIEHHLYHIVSDFLLQNPTKPTDPLALKVQGLPELNKPLPSPAVPRGWKINSIVPTHSPAVTGGGVSEDLFKDFQAVMQGQMPQGAGPSGVDHGVLPQIESGSAAKKEKKKDKKKK